MPTIRDKLNELEMNHRAHVETHPCAMLPAGILAISHKLLDENERLTGWLSYIDGGDRAPLSATDAQRAAYEAITLGRPAPLKG